MMLRLVHLQITPVYVDDDGADLTLIEGAPFTRKASEIATFPEWWAEQFAALQAGEA